MLILFFVVLVIVYVAYRICAQCNFQKIDNACQSLNALHARQAQYHTLGQSAFPAEKLWDEMLLEWRKQNARFFLVRNYKLAFALAAMADSAAKQCQKQEAETHEQLKQKTVFDREKLLAALDLFKKSFALFPKNKLVLQQVVQSQMLAVEGDQAFGKGDFRSADSEFAGAGNLIDDASEKLRRDLNDYLKQSALWDFWVAKTIDWSRVNRRLALVIDKMAHTLRLYRNGKLVSEMQVEFGPNWIGAKQTIGDRATPEGRYFIRCKKGPNQTRYHKALEINYPNSQDLRSFALSKKNDRAKNTACLGGNIEIHGKGGKYCNWTDGCMAIRDDDMDNLFSLVVIGTPVTIVGTASAEKKTADAVFSR